ncbi:MAG: glycosyltransferase family 4 protein [Proteobacteria bacterium]|nr:glycosyltransferase family 4 protein [Pseudomonadota bacterium]MBU4011023.1 glycosyltransferase family 4 protein [Pseudomonadota bacterium]
MNMLAIFSRDLEKGSTKYRLAQYLDYFKSKGLYVKLVNRDSVNKSLIKQVSEFDILLNQRYLFNYSLSRKLIEQSKRVIFDFDDAIYTRPGKPHSFITGLRVKKRMHLWLKRSDAVTTSNMFLSEYAEKYSKSVKTIPMSLDLEQWKPNEIKSGNNIVLGWTGSPVNVKLIEQLDDVLSLLLKKYPFVKLAVFSGQKPKLNCPFDYKPFQPGLEPAFVQSIDIGLLPLIDEEYYRGKSPIKAIQYIACGIPVVGNIIGATREILNDENSIGVSNKKEWIEALEKLILNKNLINTMGAAGRIHAEKKFNFTTVAQDYFNVISGI